jgi:hypothetical protein
MATVMEMKWPSISREDYDRAREAVKLGGRRPRGRDLPRVVVRGRPARPRRLGVQQDFERFTNDRLMPKLQELGIGSDQPKVQFPEAALPHRISVEPASPPAPRCKRGTANLSAVRAPRRGAKWAPFR